MKIVRQQIRRENHFFRRAMRTFASPANSALRDRLLQDPSTSKQDAWDSLWKDKITPWDIGAPTKALISELENNWQIPRVKCKVLTTLVPGCGSGYDLVTLWHHHNKLIAAGKIEEAHIVGLDLSVTSLEAAHAVLTQVELEKDHNELSEQSSTRVDLVHGDFFDNSIWETKYTFGLSASTDRVVFDFSTAQFDFIYDYTFFCALPISMRSKWGQQISKLLHPETGRLLTIMFPIDNEALDETAAGPPFPVSVEGYRSVLEPCGVCMEDGEPHVNCDTIKPRVGREVNPSNWRTLSTSSLTSTRYDPPDFSFDDDGESSIDTTRTSQPLKPPDFTIEDNSDDDYPSSKPRRARDRVSGTVSWMDRNQKFSQNALSDDNSNRNRKSRYADRNDRGPRSRERSGSPQPGNRTFRQDFRGTRVFVQGLPPHATWQDVKDHFRVAGEVVFASVSADPVTGQSKGHGVVQYETTEMAQTAIAIMRNHPLDGSTLFVREDVQEEREGASLSNRMPNKKGPTPPTKWTCANEENASYLSEEELKSIRGLIKERDFARRKRDYDTSDSLREQLKGEYNVHLDDKLKMWWTAFDGNQVPDSIKDIKGDGRWGAQKTWRQIPTTPENDACVDADLVNALLAQRDIARKEKDFSTADALLEEARTSPDNGLTLRIHDESRTWRIWTDEPPARPIRQESDPAAQCLAFIEAVDPDKLEEVQLLLEKFPGREYNLLRKLKRRYE